ncbi:protein of unknown function [Candidatus Methylomirabilis oxygeniifera]|uniref:Uncharacterized protein n=1 Tax=Methylomirabilis oxygeniifera TaxID=671143 RepID=D5MM01_METO1|nr:protein of unknown function [Candidatus Methylomirabilis oxyfera]
MVRSRQAGVVLSGTLQRLGLTRIRVFPILLWVLRVWGGSEQKRATRGFGLAPPMRRRHSTAYKPPQPPFSKGGDQSGGFL